MSFQCLTLESSFPYNLIKNVYFLATFILINSVCLLTIKIPGSQCQALGSDGPKSQCSYSYGMNRGMTCCLG
ncbi:hypothetical protein [Wolbachia pipientis]|uniref:hypothetical protein n=1 Tax=Wolbachia pipientis TaxID=955 RepID=UPI000B2C78DF|nr:hypothetical protein [Wolbachia pipientis]